MLDIIILTKTSTMEHRAMVERCILSYLQDGDEFVNSIILMESDKNTDLSYWQTISKKIKCVVPPYRFNYNLFLNIALEHCSAEYICISNNDVVTKPGCVKTMLAVFTKLPTLMSASPVDRTWHLNSYDIFPEDNKVYLGYQTSKFLLGFCIFARKQVYDTIGKFDERFHFYHQDNDYEYCLKRYNLQHALVTFAHIQHGIDKPDTGESGAEVRSKLLSSQKTFNDKWSSPLFAGQHVKYKRLSIITNTQTVPANDLVEVVDSVESVRGRYMLSVDSVLNREDQLYYLDLLCYYPDAITINGHQITKRF